MLRTSRQLSDDVWSAAKGTLFERGLLTVDGTLTPRGPVLRDEIESHTDRAAARPWGNIEVGEPRRIDRFLTKISTRMIDAGAIRPVTPIGSPWPPPELA